MDNQPNQRPPVGEVATIYVTLLKGGEVCKVEVMAHQDSSWCGEDKLEMAADEWLLVKYGHKWVQVLAEAKILDTLHKTYFAATRIIPRVHHVELIVCQSEEEALVKREELIDSGLTEATAYYTMIDTDFTGVPQGVTQEEKNGKVQVKQVEHDPHLSCDVENITQSPLGLVLKSTKGWNERTRTLVVLSCHTPFDLHIPFQVGEYYQHWQPMAILGKYWLPVNPVQNRNNAQMTFELQGGIEYVLVHLPHCPFEPGTDMEIPTWPMDVLTDFENRHYEEIFCLANSGDRHTWEHVRGNPNLDMAPIEWDATHFLYQGPPMRTNTPCSISRGLPLCTTSFIEFLDNLNPSSGCLWRNIQELESDYWKEVPFWLNGTLQASRWYVVKKKDGGGDEWCVIAHINPGGGRIIGN